MSTDQDALPPAGSPASAGPAADDSTIEHRADLHRFVFSRDGSDLAHLEYVVRDGVWVITHTFTEPFARGQGLAARVTRAALDEARVVGVRVRPVCPFVVDYIAAHPEYGDLVGPAPAS